MNQNTHFLNPITISHASTPPQYLRFDRKPNPKRYQHMASEHHISRAGENIQGWRVMLTAKRGYGEFVGIEQSSPKKEAVLALIHQHTTI